MAANRFATMLHRNTNEITLILVYAVLEWILIGLLLLNSMFSCLIVKFAEFFGLKPPCPWCTRVDHLFDPSKGDKNMNRDLLCEAHSRGISELGFCSNHRKLVDYRKMCDDCLSSRPENGEVSLNCSCCGVSLCSHNDKDKYSSYVLLKTSSWDAALECAQKQNLIVEDVVSDFFDLFGDNGDGLGNKSENQMMSEFEGNLGDAEKGTGENGFVYATVNELKEFEIGEKENPEENLDLIKKDKSVQVCLDEDAPLQISSEHLEFFLDYSGQNLVPVESINLVTEELKIEEDDVTKDQEVCVDSEVPVESVDLVTEGLKIEEDDITKDREVSVDSGVPAELIDLVKIEEDDVTKDREVSVDSGVPAELIDLVTEGLKIEEDDVTKDREVSVDSGVPAELIDLVTEGLKIEEDDVTKDREVSVDSGVPAELIDLVTEELKIEEDDVTKDQEVCVDSEVKVEVKEDVDVENRSKIDKTFLDFDLNDEPTYELSDSMEIEEDVSSLFFQAKGSHLEMEVLKHFGDFPLAKWPSEEVIEAPDPEEKETHSDIQTACGEESQGNNENEADVSIGTEIPDLDITDEMQIQDSNHSDESIHEDPSTNSANLSAVNDHGLTQVEEQITEGQSLSVHEKDNNITNNELSVQVQTELKETEEDKVPDTPTFMDESMDGSVTSELDGSDGVVTVERLKSALRSERKTLQALYAELEEERSASAVATNQTMAMINRLQEEKAAMQMEALQYQRMMEEQSEYDQEALQLLNELMVKKDKEKQELEKELEVYRKKLSDYDIKEKMKVLRKSKDGSVRSVFSSTSCSNADDSDGLSVDLTQETKEEDAIYANSDYTNQEMPVDAVVKLEESLADFEEERMSILEQLKFLEEKLLLLDYENEQSLEDVKENDNGDYINGESNGYSNEKHHTGQKGKSLLPLFDANSDENEEMTIWNGNRFDPDSYEQKFEMEGNKKVAIEEEVDHLYERLQALEADREFLKHCISSLKKGDKGMYLLQEILQHLRDLRSVELRVRK